ncbi:phage late control D family protein [Escherichia coli]|nr:phage late control D family protein [Escherichia coli]
MVVTRESDKKLKGGKVTSADSLKVNSRVSDPDSARIKADSALARHNEYQQNGSLTLTGTPQLTAGNKIETGGFWAVIRAMAHKPLPAMRLTVTAATPQSWKWHGGRSHRAKAKKGKKNRQNPDADHLLNRTAARPQ